MSIKSKFPVVIKRGSAHVKIYYTPSKGSDFYTISYWVHGKRNRQVFSDFKTAKTEAESKANQLTQGDLDVVTLKSQDRASYLRAVEALRPTGTPLELAAVQYSEAIKLLEGDPLIEAVRFYRKHHPNRLPAKTVSEVIAEFLTRKEEDNQSPVYLKALHFYTRKFSEAFHCRIGDIEARQIDEYLRSLKGAPRSRNNHRQTIACLFSYAVSQGYLHKDQIDFDGIVQAKERPLEIQIFTPEEMIVFLHSASEQLLPFLTIGAFTGLRHAEITRLDWSEINLETGFVEVKGGKSKTASRRLVPVQENLRKWLQPLKQNFGKVCSHEDMTRFLIDLVGTINDERRAARQPPVRWKHNALRHSYISYRVAQTQNVAQVALEAGNSPTIIFRNYRELVRPADAEKWFSIVPDQRTNIIPLAGAA